MGRIATVGHPTRPITAHPGSGLLIDNFRLIEDGTLRGGETRALLALSESGIGIGYAATGHATNERPSTGSGSG